MLLNHYLFQAKKCFFYATKIYIIFVQQMDSTMITNQRRMRSYLGLQTLEHERTRSKLLAHPPGPCSCAVLTPKFAVCAKATASFGAGSQVAEKHAHSPLRPASTGAPALLCLRTLHFRARSYHLLYIVHRKFQPFNATRS